MTRRRPPTIRTLTVARSRVTLGRPGSDRDPEDAVATLGVEEGESTALADLTEADLTTIRDWITAYVAALHEADT